MDLSMFGLPSLWDAFLIFFRYEGTVPIITPSLPFSAESTSTTTQNANILTPALILAIVIPIIGILLIVAFAFWFLRRKQAQKKGNTQPPAPIALKLRSPPQGPQRIVDPDAQSIMTVDTLVGPDEQKKSTEV